MSKNYEEETTSEYKNSVNIKKRNFRLNLRKKKITDSFRR